MRKLIIMLMAFILPAIAASAYEVEVGVDFSRYDINDETGEATLVYSEPRGEFIVPSTIEYDGRTYNVIAIGDKAFRYGPSSLVISEGVKYIGSSILDAPFIFESVSLPNSLISIGDGAFAGCEFFLKEVHIPENVTYIGDNAFAGNRALTSINIPENLVYLGSGAFASSPIKMPVTMPASLTSMGRDVFNGCVDIIFKGVNPPSFAGPLGCELMMVPEEGLEAYRKALPDFVGHIIAPKSFDVATTALDNASGIFNSIGEADALNTTNLKVRGTINSYDFMFIRKMLYLHTLDLSEASIIGCNYPYYGQYSTKNNELHKYFVYNIDRLKEIKLPENLEVIGDGTLEGSKIQSITIPATVTKIGGNAFKGLQLTSITLPDGLTEIGSNAFANTAIQKLTLPDNLVVLGDGAFAGTPIQTLNLPENLTEIGNTFSDCAELVDIRFGPKIKLIKNKAFSGCSKLKSVSLPTTVETIEPNAFANCSSLQEIRIPESIRTIGNEAFAGCNIQDVFVWTVLPTSINQNTFSENTYQNGTLHVPETSFQNYYWNTQWSQFLNLTSFNEPYTYFYIDDDDLIVGDGTTRLPGDPDADINGGGGLVVDGNDNQGLGDVNLDANGEDSGSIIGGESGVTGSGANININNLAIRIPVAANRWYFFCFPFDIDRDNITYDGLSVWRWYDGEWRAQHHGGAWKDFDGDVFSRWRGYIFQGSKNGMLVINIPQAAIGGARSIIELVKAWSDEARDANWNLIGNPYTSFFDMQGMDFDSPVTVWDGNKYEAYSPWDDDYTFYPFQAFFTQGEGKAEFDPDYRQTYRQHQDKSHHVARRAAGRRADRAPATDRQVINLELTDGVLTDRTRVVFNEHSTAAYDQKLDAAKFDSDNVAQIYSLDHVGNTYSINERPLGDGTVMLGISVPANGSYTISATRTDCDMMLRDLAAGKDIDISARSYTFTAEKGKDNGRFVLMKKDLSGINSIDTEVVEDAVDLYDLRGIRVDGNDAPAGIYVTSDRQKVVR